MATYSITLDIAGDLTFFELSDTLEKYDLKISEINFSGPAAGNPEITFTSDNIDNLKNYLVNEYLLDLPLDKYLDSYLSSITVK